MSKKSIEEQFDAFASLPQCVSLTGYKPGHLGGRYLEKALTNALTGTVLTMVGIPGETRLFGKDDEYTWRLVLVTPALGNPDTYGASAQQLGAVLSQSETEKLLKIWKAQAMSVA